MGKAWKGFFFETAGEKNHHWDQNKGKCEGGMMNGILLINNYWWDNHVVPIQTQFKHAQQVQHNLQDGRA